MARRTICVDSYFPKCLPQFLRDDENGETQRTKNRATGQAAPANAEGGEGLESPMDNGRPYRDDYDDQPGVRVREMRYHF